MPDAATAGVAQGELVGAGAWADWLELGCGEVGVVDDGEEPVVGVSGEVGAAVADGLEGRGRGLEGRGRGFAEVRGEPEAVAVAPLLGVDVALAGTAGAGEMLAWADPRADPGGDTRAVGGVAVGAVTAAPRAAAGRGSRREDARPAGARDVRGVGTGEAADTVAGFDLEGGSLVNWPASRPATAATETETPETIVREEMTYSCIGTGRCLRAN